MQKLREAVTEAKTAKKWQKSVKPVLDVLVTFSRDDLERMDLSQQDEYFSDALRFVGASFGGAQNVLTAVVHRDESTPHMQVLVLAQHADKRLSSSRYMGNRTQLSQLQDDFHAFVGAKHGMMRGQKRSGAKHVPVRALYGAMNAGAEPPAFKPVPPDLTMGERLRLTGYEKDDRMRQQQLAIEHNNAERARIAKQAEAGRKMHPAVLGQQAARYREAVRQAELAAKQAQEAASEAARGREEVEAMEWQLKEIDKRIEVKTEQLSALHRDVDNIRAMRDREGNDLNR
jgi:methyl-accepting chemotaxis protein